MGTFTVGRHPEKIIQRVLKINVSTKTLVERLCDLKIYAISVLSFIGSVCAPDKATLKAENHALHCTTAGPYHDIPSNLLGVGSVCGLGLDLVGIHSIRVAARYRVAACSVTARQGLEKIQAARGHNCTPCFRSLPSGRKNSLHLPWPVAPRTLSILYIAWTVMVSLITHRKTRSKSLQLDNTVTNYMRRMLLDLSLCGIQSSGTNQSSSKCGHIAPHETCVSCCPS